MVGRLRVFGKAAGTTGLITQKIPIGQNLKILTKRLKRLSMIALLSTRKTISMTLGIAQKRFRLLDALLLRIYRMSLSIKLNAMPSQ